MSRRERAQLGALLSLLKRRATDDAPDRPFSASQYLLFSAETSSHPFVSSLASQPHSPSGCRAAILTNPVWVVKLVKVRMFTAPPNSPAAHHGLWSVFCAIFHDDLGADSKRGTSLALLA